MTEANWKYTPILLFRPDVHPFEYPRMKPSFPRRVTIREEEEKEYLVSTSTLRCLLIGKKLTILWPLPKDFLPLPSFSWRASYRVHPAWTVNIWSRLLFTVDFHSLCLWSNSRRDLGTYKMGRFTLQIVWLSSRRRSPLPHTQRPAVSSASPVKITLTRSLP